MLISTTSREGVETAAEVIEVQVKKQRRQNATLAHTIGNRKRGRDITIPQNTNTLSSIPEANYSNQ
jgi:hypothetical protein